MMENATGEYEHNTLINDWKEFTEDIDRNNDQLISVR